MAAVTDRMLELLRLMHGGARLRVLPKGTAALDTSHIAPSVRKATIESMASEGFIVLHDTEPRYEITDRGRDAVRVRDHVEDFIREGLEA